MPPRWRIPLTVLITLLSLGVLRTPIFSAEAPTFSNLPATLDVSQEMTIDVNFAGDPRYYATKTYYLRGVFYQVDSQYCSFTQNNVGEWINSASDVTKLFKFDTNEVGSWSGQLKVKVDQDSSHFNGAGSYFFKVGRYTTGGSANWSDAQTLTITAPPPPPSDNPPPPEPDSPEENSPTNDSNSSNEETPEETVSTEQVNGEEEIVGLVAGATTKNPNTTKIASINLGTVLVATPPYEIIPATPSSSPSAKSSLTPWFIGGGVLLIAGGVVLLAWKRYNTRV